MKRHMQRPARHVASVASSSWCCWSSWLLWSWSAWALGWASACLAAAAVHRHPRPQLRRQAMAQTHPNPVGRLLRPGCQHCWHLALRQRLHLSHSQLMAFASNRWQQQQWCGK